MNYECQPYASGSWLTDAILERIRKDEVGEER